MKTFLKKVFLKKIFLKKIFLKKKFLKKISEKLLKNSIFIKKFFIIKVFIGSNLQYTLEFKKKFFLNKFVKENNILIYCFIKLILKFFSIK